MGINIHNPKEYCENFLMIRDKHQKIRHLKFKTAQDRLYEIIKAEHNAGRPARIIVLKARQLGISTATEAIMFQDAATRKNVRTLIVAHTPDSTTTLFRMNKLFYDNLPKRLQPMRKNSNAKQLVFENPTQDPGEKRRRPGLRSEISCVTAGEGIGRSQNLNNAHLSEFAFWKSKNKMEILNGIMQAVPYDRDTLVVIESTPNGFDEFKDLWDGAVAGENGWVPVFLPWYQEPEYRLPVEPGTVWTEEEEQLREIYRLEDEQLSWRRWCIRVNCGGDERLFRQEYPSCPEEAFLLSGDSFFDNEGIMARIRAVPEPILEGRFDGEEPGEPGGPPIGWRMTEEKHGIIRIYESPQKGHPYVLGGDTAGDGSDFFTAHVIDNTTGIQVAELHMQLSEIDYSRQIYCLGKYYNWALEAIEVNFSTYPEKKLEEWGYPNLYQRERFDTFAKKMMKAFGWATTAKTRPVMLADLHTLMEEAPESIVSSVLLHEMLQFIKGKDRKPQAADGAHDDLVMAAAICHQARGQQRYTLEEEARSMDGWTQDMLEDYERADEETRAMLLEEWGG